MPTNSVLLPLFLFLTLFVWYVEFSIITGAVDEISDVSLGLVREHYKRSALYDFDKYLTYFSVLFLIFPTAELRSIGILWCICFLFGILG